MVPMGLSVLSLFFFEKFFGMIFKNEKANKKAVLVKYIKCVVLISFNSQAIQKLNKKV